MLLKFIKKHAPNTMMMDLDEPEPAAPAVPPPKPRKNKPMNAYEQEAQINRLENRLSEFKGIGGQGDGEKSRDQAGKLFFWCSGWARQKLYANCCLQYGRLRREIAAGTTTIVTMTTMTMKIQKKAKKSKFQQLIDEFFLPFPLASVRRLHILLVGIAVLFRCDMFSLHHQVDDGFACCIPTLISSNRENKKHLSMRNT